MMREIKAEMAGTVWRILVSVGDKVDQETELVILESMKMEIPISSDRIAEIQEIRVNEGDFVDEGQIILILN